MAKRWCEWFAKSTGMRMVRRNVTGGRHVRTRRRGPGVLRCGNGGGDRNDKGCRHGTLWSLERAMRFELTTLTLARLCSTPELRPHSVRRVIVRLRAGCKRDFAPAAKLSGTGEPKIFRRKIFGGGAKIFCENFRAARGGTCRAGGRKSLAKIFGTGRKGERPPDAGGRLAIQLERAMRFELTTLTLARLCSTPELRPHRLDGADV